MARTADELVTEFCKLWASPDPDVLAEFFTEDAVYTNIPMETFRGREAIKDFLGVFSRTYDSIDIVVHRQISAANVVMNERIDFIRRKDGVEVSLPVMGVFEIVDGLIAAWRDYFDLASRTTVFNG